MGGSDCAGLIANGWRERGNGVGIGIYIIIIINIIGIIGGRSFVSITEKVGNLRNIVFTIYAVSTILL